VQLQYVYGLNVYLLKLKRGHCTSIGFGRIAAMIISGVTYNNKRASTSIVFYEKAQGWFNEKV